MYMSYTLKGSLPKVTRWVVGPLVEETYEQRNYEGRLVSRMRLKHVTKHEALVT
jgi:hypothetical protein